MSLHLAKLVAQSWNFKYIRGSYCYNHVPFVQVKADVTEGLEKLADAISDDSEAVICATGFKYSWDLLAPWKVGTLKYVVHSASYYIC